MLIYMDCVEEHPHWVGGIGQAMCRKCICLQQITEFVVRMRYGNRNQRQKTEPDKNRYESKRSDYEYLFSCQARAKAFDLTKESFSQPGDKPRQEKRADQNHDH